MPTAKKTTTRKTAPKKTAVKKVEEVKEEPVVEEEIPYEIASEIETEKRMQTGEFVDMIFPYNPALGSGDQYFEHCVNGVIYRYKRGEMVHVPKDLADTFARKEQMRTKMSVTYSEFMHGNGKKLDM